MHFVGLWLLGFFCWSCAAFLTGSGPVHLRSRRFASSSSSQFTDVEDEVHHAMQPTAGKIPVDLVGTLLLCGPGRFQYGGESIQNAFGGSGVVSAVTFSEGEEAYFRNRFVRTRRFKEEEKKGKLLSPKVPMSFMGGWAAQFLDRKRNLANRGVVYWGKRCQTLWDGGLPFKIDPKNLDSFFLDDIDQRLQPEKAGGEPFSARPRIDAKNNRLINYGYDGAEKVKLREFDVKFRCGRIREELLPTGGVTILPDFGITDRYYVFSVSPLSLNKLPYSLGAMGIDDALKQQNVATKIVLVPRNKDTSEKAVAIEVDSHMCWQIANAYDDAENVVLDMIRMDPLRLSKPSSGGPGWKDLDFEVDVPPRQLVRYTLNPGVAALSGKTTILARHCDFASVPVRMSGQRHNVIFCGVSRDPSGRSGPIQGLASVECSTGTVSEWMGSPEEVLGPFTWAPAASEARGYLVGMSSTAGQQSHVLIFSASAIGEGPICRLPVEGVVLPPASSAWYSPELTWDPENISQSIKIAGIFKKKGWNMAKSEFSGLGFNYLFDDD